MEIESWTFAVEADAGNDAWDYAVELGLDPKQAEFWYKPGTSYGKDGVRLVPVERFRFLGREEAFLFKLRFSERILHEVHLEGTERKERYTL